MLADSASEDADLVKSSSTTSQYAQSSADLSADEEDVIVTASCLSQEANWHGLVMWVEDGQTTHQKIL